MRAIHWVGLIMVVGLASCGEDPTGPGEEGAVLLAPSDLAYLTRIETSPETLEYPDTVRVGEPFEVQFEVWTSGGSQLHRKDALTVGEEVVFLTYAIATAGPAAPIAWEVKHELVVDQPGRYRLIFVGALTSVHRIVVAVE